MTKKNKKLLKPQKPKQQMIRFFVTSDELAILSRALMLLERQNFDLIERCNIQKNVFKKRLIAKENRKIYIMEERIAEAAEQVKALEFSKPVTIRKEKLWKKQIMPLTWTS